MSTYAVDAASGAVDSRADPTDERPLTEDERKLVSRLLSDPFSFPQMYKTWLVAFLEGSDLTLPLSSILGLGNLLGTGGSGSPGIFKLLPAGMVFAWAGTVVPEGTLECNGQAVDRIKYDRLRKVIGTSWGAGDGVTTFNVPDLRKRGIWGAGTSFPVAHTDGAAEGSRHPSHAHTFTGSGATDWEGDHTHDLNASGHGAAQDPNQFQSVHYLGYPGGARTDPNGGHDHGVTVSGTTSGGPAVDAPSYGVCMYIINF